MDLRLRCASCGTGGKDVQLYPVNPELNGHSERLCSECREALAARADEEGDSTE